MESEEGRYAFSAIGLSVSLFVLWRCDVLPEGRRRRDGQSQRSAVKSRLWLMNRGELPSHWDEFTLSHNHSLFSPNFCLHSASTYLSSFVSVLLLLCLSFPCYLLHRGLLPLFKSFSLYLPCFMLMFCLFSPLSCSSLSCMS